MIKRIMACFVMRGSSLPNTLRATTHWRRRGVKHLVGRRAWPGALAASLLLLNLAACGGDDDDDGGATQPPPAAEVSQGTTLQMAVLETSDLHANVLGYDYYKLAEDPSYGVDRTATLIANARRQYPNHILLDNGDTMQGTALSDYQALVQPVQCEEMVAVYRQLDALGVDAATMGNHEFNYGLPYLSQITNVDFGLDGIAKGTPESNPAGKTDCAAPAFPFVSANVVSAATGKPIFDPWVIVPKQFEATAPDGTRTTVTLDVGVIGFAPPPIMQWDKTHLEGHVKVEGWKETASRYVPEMRAAGADVVVALAHGGIDMRTPYAPDMENGAGYLSEVPGIDVLLTGHQHQLFPDTAETSPFRGQPGVDVDRGLINDVPAVQPGQWGNNLGVVALTLEYDGSAWQVQRDQTLVRRDSSRLSVASGSTPATYVAPDAAIAALVQQAHEDTIAYVKTPIGTTDFDMSTNFALVGDVSALQIVNMAQIDYFKRYIAANSPDYAGLPILSAAAPFKGGRNGPSDFTNVPQGNIAINNAADLYLYPNTLQVVRVSGDIVRQWLEKSAGQFNTIDPGATGEQALVDATFPTFNFDVLYAEGNALQYTIDLTRPKGSRIASLTYQGQPVQADDMYLVVTNNYRASGGGDFPGLAGGKGDIVLQAPDASRDVLISYIREKQTLDLAQYGADRSWSFVPVATQGPVVFHSVAGTAAMAAAHGVDNVRDTGEIDSATQLSKYELLLDPAP